MNDADHHIIHKVLGGDRDAFAVLVTRYKDRMYALALAKVGDMHTAEDIVQQAFVEAYAKLDTLRDPGRFSAWLSRITSDLCYHWWKNRQRQARQIDGYQLAFDRISADMPTPEMEYTIHETRMRIFDAVEHLGEPYREVVMLRYMEDMSYAEMADQLNVPMSTVAGRMRLAKEHLHTALTPLVSEVLQELRPSVNFTRRLITVTTLVGSGIYGHLDGPGDSAHLQGPISVTRDTDGNLYAVEPWGHRIRKIDRCGYVTTLAGSGIQGYADGPGWSAKFNHPAGIAVDPAGNLYVAEDFNHRIRKITQDGTVSTLAGSGISGYADGPAHEAQFDHPSELIVAPDGGIIVLDTRNSCIRRIDPSGFVSTIAGIGGFGNGGYADGAALSARFAMPRGLVMDKDGSIFIADTFGYRIRKLDTSGYVTTIAGCGQQGVTDGPGSQAKFQAPFGIAITGDGTLYVTDSARSNVVGAPPTIANNSIRKISRINGAYYVETIAGTGAHGFMDGTGSRAQFRHPGSIIIDDSNNLIVADSGNSRIRMISEIVEE